MIQLSWPTWTDFSSPQPKWACQKSRQQSKPSNWSIQKSKSKLITWTSQHQKVMIMSLTEHSMEVSWAVRLISFSVVLIITQPEWQLTPFVTGITSFGLKVVFLKVLWVGIFRFWFQEKLDVLVVPVLWPLPKAQRVPLSGKGSVLRACPQPWV